MQSSLAAICVNVSAMFAASQNSIPDVTFKGPALTVWPTAAGGNAAEDWNAVQIILDAYVLAASVNRGRGAGGTASDRMMGFGRLAPYAGGSGDVRFKDVSYKDLNPKFEPKEEVSPHFRVQRINDSYYGWCAAAADINREGIFDVISGPFFFLGLDCTERRSFTAARTYNSQQSVFAGHGKLRLRFHRAWLACG